jgi:Uma2 family endonuclease
MAILNQISEQEYRELALNDPDSRWELWDGMLVEKPLMSMKHDDVAFHLGYLLQSQLNRSVYRVNVNGGRTRHSPRNYFIPMSSSFQQPWCYRLRTIRGRSMPSLNRCRW